MIFSRQCKLSDRESLHHVEATILELQRYASIVPVSVPHSTMTDVTVGEYTIPKGTEVSQLAYRLEMYIVKWQNSSKM